MSLSGNLKDFGVADVFQLIAQQRKTGVLEVTRGEREIHVFFSEGQVVRARPKETRPDATLGEFLLRTGSISETDLAEAWRVQSETLEPLARVLEAQDFVGKNELERIAELVSDETIFELFRFAGGTFQFAPGRIEPEAGDRLVGAEAVLLDALRMTDEWARIESVLPDLRVVLRRTVDIEEFCRGRDELEREIRMSGADLERLFTLVNGRLTARRAIDLSRLGTFEGARGLAGLLYRQKLKVSERVQRPQKARSKAPGIGASHLVLVAAFGVAAAISAVPAQVPTSVPLGESPLAEMRANAELERLRVALETYRLREGAYPHALEGLRARPASTGLLAGVLLDGYIYAPTSEGYVLFRRAQHN